MRLVLVSLVVHGLLLLSIFDIYFRSPVEHGMSPQYPTHGPPPAKRLVLFVADGLRADAFYSVDGSGKTLAPYLRGVVETRGVWGVSHTRVPTESRPGHVAIIAGLYEDVSAVTRGWQENPVEFDSVFNRSRHTWSWGSPDILPMFAKGAAKGRVHTYMYESEAEDFADDDASRLDSWVFSQVEHFFHNASREDVALAKALQEDGNIFFLHLLGIDTNGHAHKPASDEYQENIKLVDEGIEKMEQLIEDYFHDGQTAYIFTADHGMTDWGSHGASLPEQTMTPLLAWGAGLRGAKQVAPGEEGGAGEDCWSEKWGLSHLRRCDVNQADIAPLNVNH